MDTRFDKLSSFFDKIKTIGFWQRIFGWRQITSLGYDAYKEFNELANLLDRAIKETDEAKNSIVVLNNDRDHLNSEKSKLESSLESIKEKLNTVEREITNLRASGASKDETIRLSGKEINDQEKEMALLREKVNQLVVDIKKLGDENTIFRQTEVDRKKEYENNVAALNAITKRNQDERQKEQEDLRQSEIKRFELKKETWLRHEENVKKTIKMICDKHTIGYLDKVPFKGSPDNTIKLCEEFVIFDAKSPSSDDLQNFPTYIKTQAESVKKYIKEENVRKDIFLVIPSNTVDVIGSFVYNMADYNVYIVTLDVLEPLILSLKKIEDYEFVNQLSPEERENICRIIGKFAHMTKRRIQIDQFFVWEFLEVLTKCKADLPKEIFDKVIEFEKAEKLNPPQERRAKQILDKDLESESARIQKESEAKGIIFSAAIEKSLKGLPLYESEKQDLKEKET
jgi:hypothetical protein